MQPANSTPAPRSVVVASQLIWLTIAASALMVVLDWDDASSGAIVTNILLLTFNGFVARQVASRKNWARKVYALLVALDLALTLALGLDELSELDVMLTYLILPLEIWILLKLFAAEADQWYGATRQK
jgi:NADH:ubiquinone oxidoreductase subunit 4 (subunit M)